MQRKSSGLTLRTRLVIGFTLVATVVSLVCVVVGLQYLLSYVGAIQLEGKLTPAAQAADGLLLAEVNAAGQLNNYVLTQNPDSATSYRTSIAVTDEAFIEITRLLANEEALLEYVVLAEGARDVWLTDVGDPTLNFVDQGDLTSASQALAISADRKTYAQMVQSAADTIVAIDKKRAQTRAVADVFARHLGIWLVVLAVTLLVSAALVFVALHVWVLRPLLSIRRDLGAAANGSHTHPVNPTGPPDLQALAHDAEDLRRSLVIEIDEARAARGGLEQDAPLVALIHDALTPAPAPEIPNIQVAGTSASAEGVLTGDWWDAIRTDDGNLAIVIGDTSGHGPSPTVTTLRTKSLLRGSLSSGISPVSAVEIAARGCAEDENFVTAFIALVDPARSVIRYVNAGHQPPVLVSMDDDIVLLVGTGPLLSSLGGSWGEQEIEYDAGSCLFAYTDGLIEGHAFDGSDRDPKEIGTAIARTSDRQRSDATEVLARVMAEFRAVSRRWNQDDVTAVVVSHTPMAR